MINYEEEERKKQMPVWFYDKLQKKLIYIYKLFIEIQSLSFSIVDEGKYTFTINL